MFVVDGKRGCWRDRRGELLGVRMMNAESNASIYAEMGLLG